MPNDVGHYGCPQLLWLIGAKNLQVTRLDQSAGAGHSQGVINLAGSVRLV